MMLIANRHRGEIVAELDGRAWKLCLTLGALAELEARFGAADLNELAALLGSGRLTAGQLAAIVAAGLRGAGHDVEDGEVAAMRCEGGLPGFARIAADLISATFGSGEPASKPEPTPNPMLPRAD